MIKRTLYFGNPAYFSWCKAFCYWGEWGLSARAGADSRCFFGVLGLCQLARMREEMALTSPALTEPSWLMSYSGEALPARIAL